MSGWAFALWGILGVVTARGFLVLGIKSATGSWIWTTIRPQLYLVQLAAEFMIAALVAGVVHSAPDAAMVGALIPVMFVSLSAMSSAVSSYNGEADRIRERIDKDFTPRITVNVGDNAVVQSLEGLIKDPGAERISDSMEKQEAILREMYTQGLAQARNSFRVSLAFAVMGSTVLLSGIVLAIWNAPGIGDRYASIVATSAGVVINITSSVFFVQSNRARRSMGEQGSMLREESRDDRRLTAARELATTISDTTLRDDTRARLALQLLLAPPIDRSPSSDAPTDSPAAEPGSQTPLD
ncbi:hypothetical protein AB0N05_14950 [Nocardia sp. NPDC051030]|uniref:TRADD-N-associated membrane domain-containing protein n=1 Tax=Nocardia sp. NPDC051030 TaxID=3155162 RepID=UPI003438DBFF